MEYTLSKKVKEICKTQGIQLKDLAEKMGIQPESLSRALNGNPQLSTITNIANALDVPVGELFMTSAEMLNPYNIHAFIFCNGRFYQAEGFESLLNTVRTISDEVKNNDIQEGVIRVTGGNSDKLLK